MGFEINWFVVALRLFDGFLYGVGFVWGVLLWVGSIELLSNRNNKKRTLGNF